MKFKSSLNLWLGLGLTDSSAVILLPLCLQGPSKLALLANLRTLPIENINGSHD